MTSKMKSDFSSAYKMKSGSIDKRSLRLHRRSLEWKNQRQEEANKRRNLVELSPLQEIDNNVQSNSQHQGATPRKPSNNPKPVKKDERREKLLKWRQERELKKKLEAAEKQRKNPVFKVSIPVTSDQSLYIKDVKLPPLKAKAKGTTASTSRNNLSSTSTCSASSKSTSKSSVSATKVLAPKGGTTRKGRGSAAPTSTVVASSKPKTASKSSHSVFQRLSKPSEKSQGTTSTLPAPSKSASAHSSSKDSALRKFRSVEATYMDKSSPSRNKRKQMLSKGKGLKTKSKTPTRRITRQMAQTKKVAEEVANGNISNNTSSPLPDLEKKDGPFQVNLNKVSTSRGESFSSSDFLFSAPSNVQSFAFQPLSPASASKFLNFSQAEPLSFTNPVVGRCSTPLSNRTSGSRASEASSSPSRSSAESGTVSSPSPRRSSRGRRSTRRKIVEEPPRTTIPGCVEESVQNAKEGPEKQKLHSPSLAGTSADFVQVFGKRCSLQDMPKEPLASPGCRSPRRSRRLASLTESEFRFHSTGAYLENRSDEGHGVPASEAAVDGLGGKKEAWSPRPSKDARVDRTASKTPVTFQSPRKNVSEVPMECEDADGASMPDLSMEVCSQKSDASMHTPGAKETSSQATRTRKSMSAVDTFATPGQPLSARRSNKKRRKTDLVPGQKPRSPEEWVELLANSPMIEMSRRTPRKKSPLNTQKIQPLNFDDIEQELEKSRVEMSADEPATSRNADKTPGDVSGEQAGMLVDKENVPAPEVAKGDAAPSPSGIHDVPYFRALLISETKRLNKVSTEWEDVNGSSADLSENVRGMIRTTVGQAQLLIAQRFHQFSGLVDDCEFQRGEKETTTTDLQGFWDMISFQVEDVDAKFKELEHLQKNNWVEKTPKTKTATRQTKKKRAAKASSKPAGKSKFAAFREQMKKKMEVEEAKDAGGSTSHAPDAPTPASPPVPEKEEVAQEKVDESNAEVGKEPAPGTSTGQEGQSLYPFMSMTPSLVFMEQTPRRKSYVPAVPSPLLRDITPKENSTKDFAKGSMPRRRLSQLSWMSDTSTSTVELMPASQSGTANAAPSLDGSSPKLTQNASPLPLPGSSPRTTASGRNQPESAPSSSGAGKASSAETVTATPKSSGKNSQKTSGSRRRSVRQRKSVSFLTGVEEEPAVAEEAALPETGDSPVDLERYLMPSQLALKESPAPSTSPQRRTRSSRKSSLKSDKRHSSQSVHFDSSLSDSSHHTAKLPITPFNHDSLKPRSRVSSETSVFTPGMEADEAAALEREDVLVDLATVESCRPHASQTPARRSLRPRPSLLFTPEKKETFTCDSQDLMTFSP